MSEFARPNRAMGQRGKKSEAAVKSVLDELQEKMPNFCANRQYDAKSAGGRFPAQPADFQWFFTHQGQARSGLIEVKEVAHDFRLPKKNFSQDEIARMRRRQMAGQVCTVLVNHSTTGKWRSVPLDYFIERLGQPSWDLSEFTDQKPLWELIAGEMISA